MSTATVLPVSTPIQYFPAGWADSSRPRGAMVTGVGEGVNTYHITVFPDPDRDVSEGKKMPIVTRRNVPAYPTVPARGYWPPHDFLVPLNQAAPAGWVPELVIEPAPSPTVALLQPDGEGSTTPPAPQAAIVAPPEPTPPEPDAPPVINHGIAALRVFKDYPTLTRGTEGLQIKPRLLQDRFQMVSNKGITLFEAHADASDPEDIKLSLHAYSDDGKVVRRLGPASSQDEVHAMAVAAVKICRAAHKAKDKKAAIAAIGEALRS